jgi:uncharacterized membrane protein required for colicin V production
MQFATVDYVILAATLVAAVFGLFGGFSGALAFLAGVGAAAASVRFGWGALESRIGSPWLLGLAALAMALVAFGIARLIVKKTVHKMLAQPGDAIFGFLVSAVSGFALSVSAVYALNRLGLWESGEESLILNVVLSFVG